jgi:5-methylcytosine-specific restriction endonuclease McrA
MREELKALHRTVVMLRANAARFEQSKWFGKCLRCGNRRFLQVSHIFPKGQYRSVEFDPDNAVALCAPCHLYWWHKNPVEAARWIETVTPNEIFAALSLRARSSRHVNWAAQRLALNLEIKRRVA